jgi:hypothetical protein
MDKNFILNTYSNFLKTWRGYNTPALLLTSGVLDINNTNNVKKIVLYQVVPTHIDDNFYESIKININNPEIFQINLICKPDNPIDFVMSKISVIYMDNNDISYNDILVKLDNNFINVILYDIIIFDYTTTHLLTTLTETQLGLISSKYYKPESDIKDFANTFFKDDTCCEFNGFVVNGVPTIMTDFYINMYGSKNLFIQKFFKNSFEIVNLSKLCNTFLVKINEEYSLENNYVNTPNFSIIFCFDQVNAFLPKQVIIEENLVLDDIDGKKNPNFEKITLNNLQKNIQDFIPLIKYINIVEFENILKYNLKTHYNSLIESNNNHYNEMEERVKNTESGLTSEMYSKIESLQRDGIDKLNAFLEDYTKKRLDEIDILKNKHKEDNDSELNTLYILNKDKINKQLQIYECQQQKEIYDILYKKKSDEYSEEMTNILKSTQQKITNYMAETIDKLTVTYEKEFNTRLEKINKWESDEMHKRKQTIDEFETCEMNHINEKIKEFKNSIPKINFENINSDIIQTIKTENSFINEMNKIDEIKIEKFQKIIGELNVYYSNNRDEIDNLLLKYKEEKLLALDNELKIRETTLQTLQNIEQSEKIKNMEIDMINTLKTFYKSKNNELESEFQVKLNNYNDQYNNEIKNLQIKFDKLKQEQTNKITEELNEYKKNELTKIEELKAKNIKLIYDNDNELTEMLKNSREEKHKIELQIIIDKINNAEKIQYDRLTQEYATLLKLNKQVIEVEIEKDHKCKVDSLLEDYRNKELLEKSKFEDNIKKLTSDYEKEYKCYKEKASREIEEETLTLERQRIACHNSELKRLETESKAYFDEQMKINIDLLNKEKQKLLETERLNMLNEIEEEKQKLLEIERLRISNECEKEYNTYRETVKKAFEEETLTLERQRIEYHNSELKRLETESKLYFAEQMKQNEISLT